MIRCHELTRKYGDLTAVESVSFEIDRGEIVGLLGHNGAGKTTIMKMITGYLEPTAGKVTIDGLDLQDHRVDIQSRLGYLPEVTPVYSEMSIVEYLDYVAGLRGIPDAQRVEKVTTAMKRTEITERSNQLIGTLSRGFRQRVGVAQAILHDPEILILDEPTNGLDPSQIHEMRSLIKELSQHSTVILSTHILQEVQAICDRVLIVLNGELALDASLDDLKASNRVHIEIEGGSLKDQSALGELELVTGVEEIPSNNGVRLFQLEMRDTQPGSRAQLVKQLVEKGIEVSAIHPEQRDLETVFREINERPAN